MLLSGAIHPLHPRAIPPCCPRHPIPLPAHFVHEPNNSSHLHQISYHIYGRSAPERHNRLDGHTAQRTPCMDRSHAICRSENKSQHERCALGKHTSHRTWTCRACWPRTGLPGHTEGRRGVRSTSRKRCRIHHDPESATTIPLQVVELALSDSTDRIEQVFQGH